VFLEPDFGTALSLVMIVGVMVFSAGLSYRYIFGVGVAAVPILAVALLIERYRIDRLLAFLDPWGHRQDDGFQVIQSFIAIGTGGFLDAACTKASRRCCFYPNPTQISFLP
jgi:cell division protein FtsW